MKYFYLIIYISSVLLSSTASADAPAETTTPDSIVENLEESQEKRRALSAEEVCKEILKSYTAETSIQYRQCVRIVKNRGRELAELCTGIPSRRMARYHTCLREVDYGKSLEVSDVKKCLADHNSNPALKQCLKKANTARKK